MPVHAQPATNNVRMPAELLGETFILLPAEISFEKNSAILAASAAYSVQYLDEHISPLLINS